MINLFDHLGKFCKNFKLHYGGGGVLRIIMGEKKKLFRMICKVLKTTLKPEVLRFFCLGYIEKNPLI